MVVFSLLYFPTPGGQVCRAGSVWVGTAERGCGCGLAEEAGDGGGAGGE